MNRIRGDEGYSLVELMVVLLVTLMLGGVLFSVYLASAKWMEPWRREITLEDHTHLIVQRLARDLTFAEQMKREEDATWTLTYPSGRIVQYRYQDNRLRRNGHQMHAPTLLVVDFRLVPSRLETQYALRRRDSRVDDERSLIQVEIHLALESRERALAVATIVAPRRHRPWYPLPWRRSPEGGPHD